MNLGANVARSVLAFGVTNYGLAKGWTDDEINMVFQKALTLKVEETTTPRSLSIKLDEIYGQISAGENGLFRKETKDG